MQSNNVSFLRRVLAADAVSCGGMGLAMLTFTPIMAKLTNLPADLLQDAALVLLPFAAFLAYLASRTAPPRAGVWVVIAVNAIWVIDSFVLLFSGWVEPNALGYAFVIAQALVVGVLAELEYVGLKRAARPLAA